MAKQGTIKKSLLAAYVSVSLLQPITYGVFGSLLVGAASGAARAQPMNAEAIARVAQAITVRIEGAIQGSGVLIDREGNRYTVLTAWHVVSGQRPGEELAIITPDGKQHQLGQGSITRLGQVDLAVLKFSSTSSYQLAQIGSARSVASGSDVFVSGFPLPTTAVPNRLLRFRNGRLEANAQVFIPNGYQLLYNNQTLPGMSGGAVLDANGRLVGIHASAERADEISESSGKAVATGTNQGVPIDYYIQFYKGVAPGAASKEAITSDDYLAQATQLLGQSGSERKVISLGTNAIGLHPSARAYRYRGWAYADLGEYTPALNDYKTALALSRDNQTTLSVLMSLSSLLAKMHYMRDSGLKREDIVTAIRGLEELDPSTSHVYYQIGNLYQMLGSSSESSRSYRLAATVPASDLNDLSFRGLAQRQLGLTRDAFATFNQIIESPSATTYQRSSAYANKSSLLTFLNQWQQACPYLKMAVKLKNPYATNYFYSDLNVWCK